jgi:epoxide hydrolase-like predicted phosphatase
MITTIVLDIGGVLIDNPAGPFIDHCAKELQCDKELLRQQAVIQLPLFQQGIIDESEFWVRITQSLKVDNPNRPLWLDGLKSSYKEKVEIFDELKSLRSQGFRLVILSNTEPPIIKYLKTLPSFSIFDAFFVSNELHCIKPNKVIYEKVIESCRCKPSEMIFIDDKPENLEPAKAMGMHTILFKNEAQCLTELNQLI